MPLPPPCFGEACNAILTSIPPGRPGKMATRKRVRRESEKHGAMTSRATSAACVKHWNVECLRGPVRCGLQREGLVNSSPRCTARRAEKTLRDLSALASSLDLGPFERSSGTATAEAKSADASKHAAAEGEYEEIGFLSSSSGSSLLTSVSLMLHPRLLSSQSKLKLDQV